MINFPNDDSYEKRCRAAAIWLTAIISVAIGILTVIPADINPAVPGGDKSHHFLAFAALILPCATLYPKALFKSALAAAVYGGLIEVIQPYVGRSGELADFIADVCGIGAGAALGLVLHWTLRRVFPTLIQRDKDSKMRSFAKEKSKNLPIANSES